MATGYTDGGVRQVLRLEGLALLLAALFAYDRFGADWWLFAILFLAPDLSFIGYLAGERVGAIAYNSMHATLGPLLLGAGGIVVSQPRALAIALIWLGHIGFDRALGYGLKHAKGFGFTHLGPINRAARES